MLSDESVAELKQILVKQGTVFKTDNEYREVGENLIKFYTTLAEWEAEDRELQRRLEREPKRFAIPGECRTCPLCDGHIDDDMWYDKWGLKCMACQDALNRKIIPGYVFRDYQKKRHVTAYTLTGIKNIHAAAIRKLVRQGKLKARAIPGNGTLVFLRSENPDLDATIDAHCKPAVRSQA